MAGKVKVMLSTEGTYPFHQGGVSTWCDSLIKGINEVDYVLYSIIMNPFVTQKFNIPSGVDIIKVPLWGTEEPSEHLNIPFSQVYMSKKRTTDQVIKNRFIPLFQNLIDEILKYDKNPQRFGSTLLELYNYFQEFEYKKSFKSELTWNTYKSYIINSTKEISDKGKDPGIYSMIQSLGWIYRFFILLNTPLPEVDVSHSAAAAFCGVPCVLSKLKHGTPFLLTEHGVYLREQYLALGKRQYPEFLSFFLIRFLNSITRLNYFFADQVSPVCSYNTRWEKELGVSEERIKVIYNGVDQNLFTPSNGERKNKYPTVLSVARIDPVKDLISLIRAAEIVKREIPEIRFIVYGSVTVPEYYEECVELVSKLNLNKTFIFAGHTDDVSSVYSDCDIVVLSSITEAFPYSVIEAMMTGKAVIATDVGGVMEALEGCGIVVPPGRPEELAKAVSRLIRDSDLRISLGKRARERALGSFTIKKAQEQYLESYKRLSVKAEGQKIISRKSTKQKLLMEKGYALMELGLLHETIIQFKMAIRESASSPAVPAILTEIAMIYSRLGMYDEAVNELEKAEIMASMIKKDEKA